MPYTGTAGLCTGSFLSVAKINQRATRGCIRGIQSCVPIIHAGDMNDRDATLNDTDTEFIHLFIIFAYLQIISQ